MRPSWRCYFLGCLLCGHSGRAIGDTTSVDTARYQLPTTIVTANRYQQPLQSISENTATVTQEQLRRARVIIVVAGMEGALPSVLAGLVSVPVIAVPTSVGYGASFGGVAALLGMLNSCANGVTVVNIDNGFGAAATASLINHL